MKKTLVKNIVCLQTPVGSYSHKGSKQGINEKYNDVEVLIEDGIIKEITANGSSDESQFDQVIDAEGKLVTPGLVDGHTHLVFGGYRQHELAMKIAGAGYLDILRAGGGILDTVRKTRDASEEELYEKSAAFLDEMLGFGITTCEAKSGYGLTKESELKMLRVINALKEKHTMDVVPTFMGAHAIPPEYEGRGDEYIEVNANGCRSWTFSTDEAADTEYAVFNGDLVENYAMTIGESGDFIYYAYHRMAGSEDMPMYALVVEYRGNKKIGDFVGSTNFGKDPNGIFLGNGAPNSGDNRVVAIIQPDDMLVTTTVTENGVNRTETYTVSKEDIPLSYTLELYEPTPADAPDSFDPKVIERITIDLSGLSF